MGAVFDFVHQMVHKLADLLGVLGGEAPDVVVQTCHVVAVHAAKVGHGQAAIFAGQVGVVVDPGLNLGVQAFHHGQIASSGNNQLFAHVAYHFVKQQDNRRAVGFSHVKGLYRDLKHVLNARRGKHNDGMVAVRAPAGLVHVALRHLGGQTCGGAAALHVDNNAGNFGHHGIANGLLLERKTGAAGSGHGLGTGQRSAAHSAHGGYFVFHLNKLATHAGQLLGQMFGYFCGRGNGIARKKTQPGIQGSAHTGFVTLHKEDILLAHAASLPVLALPVFSTETARSGQYCSHMPHSTQSSGL